MPELPEVETVCRGLSNKLLHLTVKKIEIIDIKLRYLIPKTILNYLNHKKVKRIIRRGKIGIIVFDGSYNFYFHLGMTGKFIIYEKLHKVKKHDHLIIKFSNSLTLVYNDVRKFGFVGLLKKPQDIVNFKQLGIEPFLSFYFKCSLFNQIKVKNRTIKDMLLDQKYICGIGNIYANEVLFHAKISPLRLCINIKELEFYRVLEAIKYILSKSIKSGGSSIKDYVHIDEELGYYQTEFKVYRKHDKPCFYCNSLIIRIKQNGRSSFYCKKCQK